jgi:signal transduction histidine kinase
VAAVVVVAVALLALLWPHDVRERMLDYAIWVAICVASESLWINAMSGSGTVSMASTAGLASVVLWGQGASAWIVGLSTLIADKLVLKKPWVRAVFNFGQASITMVVAAAAFAVAGGPLQGLMHAPPLPPGPGGALAMALPIVALCVVYLLVNRALVALAMAWSSDRPYLRVLREDWFNAERLLEDTAAFLLSPLMVVSFQALWYWGVLLFYAPLRIINESGRRYVALHDAQQQVIRNERMAAKGEIAARVSHELRNILAAIRARGQMISKELERNVTDNIGRNTQIILEQVDRMKVMADDMMAFSSNKVSMERVDLNALTERTIELVRAEPRFQGVAWDVTLANTPPEVRVDPGQITQVITNLFQNAADAMGGQPDGTKRILVCAMVDERARQVRLVVTDTGPGIPQSNLAKVFEPHFTTKKTGHGYGLATSYMIVQNHKGKLSVESPLGQGATFTILFPQYSAKEWSG